MNLKKMMQIPFFVPCIFAEILLKIRSLPMHFSERCTTTQRVYCNKLVLRNINEIVLEVIMESHINWLSNKGSLFIELETLTNGNYVTS